MRKVGVYAETEFVNAAGLLYGAHIEIFGVSENNELILLETVSPSIDKLKTWKLLFTASHVSPHYDVLL